MIKILLTGLPGCGKTTVINQFIKIYHGKKHGFVTHEVRNEEGNRVGFEVENLKKESRLLAHKFELKTDLKIFGKSGIPFYVDSKTIDDFILPEISFEHGQLDSILVMDEIGRMQANSTQFLAITQNIFLSNQPILATIVFDDEPWSIAYKTNPKVLLINVSINNRDELPDLLVVIFNAIKIIKLLTKNQRLLVNKWTHEYFFNEKYTLIKKLYKKAIRYVLEKKINQVNQLTYEILGDHSKHVVNDAKNGNFVCDCELFLQTKAQVGDCSHIQATKLYLSK